MNLCSNYPRHSIFQINSKSAPCSPSHRLSLWGGKEAATERGNIWLFIVISTDMFLYQGISLITPWRGGLKHCHLYELFSSFAILAQSPNLLSELTASFFLSRKLWLLGWTTSLCSNSDDTVLSCNEHILAEGQAAQSKTSQLNSNTDGRGSVSAYRSCFFLPWKPLSSMSGPFFPFLSSLHFCCP